MRRGASGNGTGSVRRGVPLYAMASNIIAGKLGAEELHIRILLPLPYIHRR
jgi:hypothetical protein